MELTDDDVLEILKLFEQSKFEFLHLQQGERKITVSKGGYVPLGTGAVPASAPAAPAAVAASAPSPAASKPVPKSVTKPDIAVADRGLVPITAPVVGKFYASASPSDPPYVEQGVIEQILVPSGQYVEFGQTLFLLRPDNEAA